MKSIRYLILSFLLLPAAQGAGLQTETATFAGGCFWCMESPFEKLPGVIEAVAGYTGGHVKNPTYEQVSSGSTGHAEAVKVTFDPKKISYEKLLRVYWRTMNPTDAGGQFADRGSQYRTVIFYHSDEQKKLAQKSKDDLAKSGKFKEAIVTDIAEATTFYPAEDYHQNYYKNNPIAYDRYRKGSGRAQFLNDTWGKEKK